MLDKSFIPDSISLLMTDLYGCVSLNLIYDQQNGWLMSQRDCGWVIEVANMYLCLNVVAGNPSCSTGWLIQTGEHRNQGCLASTWDTRKNTLAVPFVK